MNISLPHALFLAERKQSLGYDWHPECLRCEECGKRLNPGQHAEHKGVPYCHVPCYGALFGPQLFGHGTRVESHKSFGQQKESPKMGNGPTIPRNHVESKLKAYNQYFDGKSGEIRSREVNGRLVLEGSLRIHWGVQGVIHLKENDDQRTVVTVRKRNSRISSEYDSDEDIQDITTDSSCYNLSLSTDVMLSSTDTLSPDEKLEDCVAPINVPNNTDESTSEDIDNDSKQVLNGQGQSQTLPMKLDIKNVEWDELDDLLQVERKVDEGEKLYRTMPAPLIAQSSVENSTSTDSSSTEKADQEVSTITEQTLTINGNNSVENGDYDYENGDMTLSTHTNTRTDMQTPTQTETSDTKATMENSWSESNHLNRSMSGPDCLERMRNHSPEFDRSSASMTSCDTSRDTEDSEVVVRRAAKSGSTAIKRRPGKRLSRSKIKRRCSINGHFYDRETSFFTPPHGSQMSVWVTSLVNTQEVINLLLEKYKVESYSNNFALFAVRDNGGMLN